MSALPRFWGNAPQVRGCRGAAREVFRTKPDSDLPQTDIKTNHRIRARTSHTPITPTTAQWHDADTALQALRTAFNPLLHPLSADERRQLLGLGAAYEPFVEDYITLLRAQADQVPALLRPADTLRDWQTRAELLERQALLAQLSQDVADMLAGLEGDRMAAARAGYRMLARDRAPAGLEAVVAPLREHMALRLERRRRTRALKLAAAASAPGNAPGGPTPPANVTRLPAAASSSGLASSVLAA